MRLAVLSACATDVSEVDSTAGPGGLGVVFLRLGVPRVVGSRWEVDSLSTEFLMGRFYETLTAGVDVEAALNRAESDLRSTAEWNHPYFWASFETLGSP
jgi:CHAT domain-containing protein